MYGCYTASGVGREELDALQFFSALTVCYGLCSFQLGDLTYGFFTWETVIRIFSINFDLFCSSAPPGHYAVRLGRFVEGVLGLDDLVAHLFGVVCSFLEY